MMRHTLIYITVLLTCCYNNIGSLGAQNHRGSFRLEQRSLREKGDSVELSLDLRLFTRPLAECQSLWITPILTSDKATVCFPYIELTGRDRNRANKRWLKSHKPDAGIEWPAISLVLSASTDTLLRYRTRIPLEDWMAEAELILEEELRDCGGDQRLHSYRFDTRVEPVLRAPYPVSPRVNSVAIDPEQFCKKGEVFLHFRVNESHIDPLFSSNASQLDSIYRLLQQIGNYPKAHIRSVSLKGYASPEGNFETNEFLARARAFAVKDYLQRHYRIPDSLFQVEYIPEDWAGLHRMIERSRMEHRSEILEIIDRVSISRGRKSLLMKLDGGRPYRQLLQEQFPLLRRTAYQIEFSLTPPTSLQVEEGSTNLHTKEETIREYDEEWLLFLLKLLPDNVPVRVNLAAIRLSRSDLLGAAALLNGISEDPLSFNNMGVWYLLSGDLDQAETYFLRATKSGVHEAEHNLLEVKYKREADLRLERYTRRKPDWEERSRKE